MKRAMNRKTGKHRIWNAVMVICCIVAAGCIVALLYIWGEQRKADATIQAASSDPLRVLPVLSEKAEASDPSSAPDDPENAESAEAVDIPIDFELLRGVNKDIYAWLYMGYSTQEYPVLQNSGDDSYYLHRDVYGAYSAAGSLFTESFYNSVNFDDPCTVIYGHNMGSGAMFGNLERTIPYLDLNNAEDEQNYLTVYTPSAVRIYRILCAGTFSEKHLLYTYDFSDEGDFSDFFSELESYPEGGYYACEDRVPEYGDQLLILSTCHRLRTAHRYLAVAVLTEQYGS